MLPLASVLTAALSCDALGENLYIETISWCWISTEVEKGSPHFWTYMSSKGWEIGSLAVTVILIVIIRLHLARQASYSSGDFSNDFHEGIFEFH